MVKIDWSENSTKRGIIWVIASVVGLPMVWVGKDITGLIALAMGVSGGLGVLLTDKKVE
jgi:hypothetical protein